MALTNAAAGFIGASVTLVLVIIFMILMVILVRQCLAFVSKRNAIRAQVESQRQIREQIRQRRGSVTEAIPATFDWHHTIRIAGTPPPSYGEAKDLPSLDNNEANTEQDGTEIHTQQANGVHPQANMEVVVQVEDGKSGGVGGHGGIGTQQDEDRTFATGYTQYSAA